MSPEMSIATLVERVDGQHRETMRRFDEMKVQLTAVNMAVLTHESRISTLEAKQGMIIKIIFAAAGGGSAVGAGVFGLFRLAGGG